MKRKIILLLVCAFGVAAVKAYANNEPAFPCKKKCDLMGVIVSSDNKKPLKDVSITAYSIIKKEKVTKSDEAGNFSFDELKPGTYKFIFEKTGFRRVTKENVVIKSDDAFQMNIEMIENMDFDLKPSPFHFIDI
ncbi:MAG: carboxypeptidase regulatory-like domain-containing protein [Bacteroidetes bacterium]|nr:carboxypeptidase regulatory-like domain-containing protein [Bacteroidota bacterium]MBS1929665.1 carboxypeptidase regulatory-like domain-containing protein [Bacteroidota bacterium]